MAVESISSLFSDNPITVLNDDCMFEVAGDFGAGVVSGAVKASVLKSFNTPTLAAVLGISADGGNLDQTNLGQLALASNKPLDLTATSANTNSVINLNHTSFNPTSNGTTGLFTQFYGLDDSVVMCKPDAWFIVGDPTAGVRYKSPLYQI